MDQKHMQRYTKYTLQDFYPLIGIFIFILMITLASQYYQGWNLKNAMRVFMGSFFLIFGFFKIINLHAFAQAYAIYDLIAKRYFYYGYIYPFFELGLGVAYLFNWYPILINIVTLILMLLSAASVFYELQQKRQIECGCLGAVFKIPMTYVTLIEDLLMAGMALLMLII